MCPFARPEIARTERSHLRSVAALFATDTASANARAGMTRAGMRRSACFEVGDAFAFDAGPNRVLPRTVAQRR